MSFSFYYHRIIVS